METTRAQPVEYKRTHFEVKAVDVTGSTFEGYSAGIGNEDEGRDIIMPGAFKKTIRERVASGAVKWLDQHNTFSAVAHLLGKVVQAKEVPVGEAEAVHSEEGLSHLLWSKFLASTKQAAQDALRDIDAGILDGLSIGYRPVKMEFEKDEGAPSNLDAEIAWLTMRGVRKLKELAWWETSTVIWGMNAAALVVPGSVKSLLARAEAAADMTSEIDPRDLLYAVRDLRQVVKESQVVPEVLRDPDIGPTMHRVEELVETVYKHGLAPIDHIAMVETLMAEYKDVSGEVEGTGFGAWVESLWVPKEAAPETAVVDVEEERPLGLILDQLTEGINEVRLLLDQDQPAHAGEEDPPEDVPAAPAEEEPVSEVAGEAEVPSDDEPGDESEEPTDEAPVDVDAEATEQDSDEHFPSEEELAEEAEYLRTLRLQMEE